LIFIVTKVLPSSPVSFALVWNAKI